MIDSLIDEHWEEKGCEKGRRVSIRKLRQS